MRKKYLGLLLTIALLLGVLCGCGDKPSPTMEAVMETTWLPETAEATVPATVPADGNPEDVTCKGSYTAEMDADAAVASVGGVQLTNEQLQAYYWAEVAAYRQAEYGTAPDFDRPLDTQACEIDDSVFSWQQYFLRRALNAWHGAQALVLQGRDEGLPVEEAYQPNLKNYEEYMTGMPATKYLYRYNKSYQPNTMHQDYLDNIPAMLEELAGNRGYGDASSMAREAFGTTSQALAEFTELYNRGYMYVTSLSYYIETTPEEVEAYFTQRESDYAKEGITRGSGKYVDIRHILLVPGETGQDQAAANETTETVEASQPVAIAADGTVTCSDASWESCREEAEALLARWQSDRNATEATFADLANKNSADSGSVLNGGAYRRLRQGQLMPLLDQWCFDQGRQSGDTVILRSDYGYHILYFSGSTDIWYAQAQADLTAQRQAELVSAAREKYPAEIDYSAITLAEAGGTVSTADVLYPDVAHERFPEIPLYLQQDYGSTWYGGHLLRTNGCGITSFAMVASYLTDTEVTPPQMCARYGNYSFSNGTDGTIFNKESAVMGFYLKEKTYEPAVAKAALEEGHVVVSVHSRGYWTRGGHYIVLEKLNEDGTVQVRDSNIYNYGRIQAHKDDKHSWGSVTTSGLGYWIFEYKAKNSPACVRCGNPEGVVDSLMAEDYYCEKCSSALLRRETYLTACGE